jgi:hypothetical protein
MKMRFGIALLFLCALSTAAEAPPQADDAALREKVTRLVAQLGSDEFSVRDNASKELLALGERGFAIIKTLTKSTDAETNLRLRKICVQFSIADVKTLAEALELRRKFLDDGKRDLAAEATRKAESIAKPIQIADALRESALAEYRTVKIDTGMGAVASSKMKRVLMDLDDSINYYDQHMKAHPEDKNAESRQTEASMIAYGCRKYLSL